MKPVFYITNITIYTLLAIVVIVYITTQSTHSQIPQTCRAKSNPIYGSEVVSLIYKLIVTMIAAVLTTMIWIYGLRLIYFFMSSMESYNKSFLKFTVVVITCGICLLLQFSLLLYASFSSDVNTVGSIIMLIIIELVPAAMFLLTLKLPALIDWSLLESIIYCLSNTSRLSGKTTSDLPKTGSNSPKFPTTDDILVSSEKNNSL